MSTAPSRDCLLYPSVVTAGNPPEYNRTAHDFDIATWDRLKRIDVEPDFAAWRDFAVETGVHPAVLTYLDIERDHFYRVETTVDGKSCLLYTSGRQRNGDRR